MFFRMRKVSIMNSNLSHSFMIYSEVDIRKDYKYLYSNVIKCLGPRCVGTLGREILNELISINAILTKNNLKIYCLKYIKLSFIIYLTL